MHLVTKHSFEIRTENRNYQFVLNTDSPEDEFLSVLAAAYNYFKNVKDEREKQSESPEPKETA